MASTCLLLPALPVAAQPSPPQPSLHGEHAAGENFGRVTFPVSCSPAAQERFSRAVAMLHSFHYPGAEQAFTALAEAEPDCAMAWWGVAISQRPNPLVPPFSPAALQKGWQAIERARAAPPRTERERDWIEAMAAFFQDHARATQRRRTLAYEAAMERLAAEYPDDDEAQIFYALALNEAVDPGDKTYARQLKAGGHPGADRGAAARPSRRRALHHPQLRLCAAAKRGLPAARRYAALAPAGGHALHMPSHVFSTLGLWQEVIASDLAADANFDLGRFPDRGPALRGASRDHPAPLPLGGLPDQRLHAARAGPQGGATPRPIPGGVTEPVAAYYAFHTGFTAAFVRCYAFDRGAWAEAAVLPVPTTPYPQAEAITRFGRAIGAARNGDPARAAPDLDRIRALRGQLAAAGEAYWAEQVQVQETAAAAWIALAEGRREEALRLMQAAADLEDRTEKHVAMENRLSPMRELLGEMLLATGQPAEALASFEVSLRTSPNRYRSLAGAALAAEQAGDRAAARRWSTALLELTATADTERPEMAAARRRLTAN